MWLRPVSDWCSTGSVRNSSSTWRTVRMKVCWETDVGTPWTRPAHLSCGRKQLQEDSVFTGSVSHGQTRFQRLSQHQINRRIVESQSKLLTIPYIKYFALMASSTEAHVPFFVLCHERNSNCVLCLNTIAKCTGKDPKKLGPKRVLLLTWRIAQMCPLALYRKLK